MMNALAAVAHGRGCRGREPEESQTQRRGLSCVVEGVRDGASFYCRDGTPVRLHGINPPAMGLCPDGDCLGARSRRALGEMITGRRVSCRRTGMTFGRVTAWCRAAGEDLSCALFRRNLAERRTSVDQDDRLCRDP